MAHQYTYQDTIVALSTPPGIGAVGIIRVSGPKSIDIVGRCFSNKKFQTAGAYTIHFGKIRDEAGRVLDEVLISLFRGPKSYTKEDTVEISCHGSPYIIQQVLALLIRLGARHATPGEFTLRAFLNGQLDLAQAEAVADLIASDSEAAHHLAMQQMKGGFSKLIQSLRQELIDFAALLELELDFSEEDVEFADRTALKALVDRIRTVISQLLSSFSLGNVMKNGVQTVIAGKPNAGKSTLLNGLLNENRAIVSDIAGTTRDSIEANLNIDGILFRLVDTAGLRTSEDQIEQIGVRRSKELVKNSSIIIYVFDVSETNPEALRQELHTLFEELGMPWTPENLSKLVCVANKMDLNPYIKMEDYTLEGFIHRDQLIPVAAVHQMNIEYLKSSLFQLATQGARIQDQSTISTARHYDALYQSDLSLRRVMDGLHSGISSDFVAQDLRQALYYLGLITGEVSTDDLLESIFTRFCIGK